MHDKQVRRRRAVLGLLVALSLILLTAYFGESPSSPLHTVQRRIVEVISPVQAGASTVLTPVKDVAGWFSDTFQAKGQRDRLRRQVANLTQQADYYHQQAILAQQLRNQIGLDQSNSIGSYHPVTASVYARDPTLWYQTIYVDKGSDNGISVNDPVTGDGYLVGRVTTVDPTVSIVTLVTDPSYAVTAEVLGGGGDTGILVPAVGTPGQMFLQNLPPHATIQTGDQVVTAGFKDIANPKLDSLYPPGLPIGQVSNASQNELLNNQQVTVVPGASLRHLAVVQILTAPHAGTARAQVGTGG
ncbi:MAG: rod shape-determining protein MreC [Actinomycetota bacterium]|nr:rod shape-determining protein MreC [Actinomycetota bacterium]